MRSSSTPAEEYVRTSTSLPAGHETSSVLAEIRPLPLVATTAECACELAPAEAVLGRASPPVLAKAWEVDRLLPVPRRDCRDLRRAPAYGACGFDVLDDLTAPLRELGEYGSRNTAQLRHPLARLLPPDAQPV